MYLKKKNLFLFFYIYLKIHCQVIPSKKNTDLLKRCLLPQHFLSFSKLMKELLHGDGVLEY
jgi:hypothetical protein